MRASSRTHPAPYLPREVFLTFDVFFVADFATGFSGVPAASALSFCFLVAIEITTSRAAASRTARPSFRSPGSSRAPVLRQQRPSARRSESQSWSHHRFCGQAALDGDVTQTITTGLKRHSVAHALPRSPSSLEQPRTAGRTGDQLPAERASPRRIDRLESKSSAEAAGARAVDSESLRCGLTQSVLTVRVC